MVFTRLDHEEDAEKTLHATESAELNSTSTFMLYDARWRLREAAGASGIGVFGRQMSRLRKIGAQSPGDRAVLEVLIFICSSEVFRNDKRPPTTLQIFSSIVHPFIELAHSENLHSTRMATTTASSFISSVILQPLIVAISSAVYSSLLSYEMVGNLDWRPIVICATSDVLVIAADHLKDQEIVIGSRGAAVIKRFTPLAPTFFTAVFTSPAFLWTTPLDLSRVGAVLKRFIGAHYSREVDKAHKPFVIKRVPGMKAFFSGTIRSCGVFLVVQSALQSPWKSTHDALPWTIAETLVWSMVNRTGHCIMSDVRDYDEDKEAGVPTIPVLLDSLLKTRMILTVVHAAILTAFRHNPFIVASSCFAIALVWILGKDTPKPYFRLSLHSQSIFIVTYAVMLAFGLDHYCTS
ncbi:uncharacterized protein F5147DRAFT_835179 [Suillus discolor]|uniref:UbiA prenyltransferase family-domain-containing protein n=1 Tax=Suillus discolor TaxID=1912936 RepID=A0A9P7FDR1_9AGAM|nr:uncharacterized protein F5147DRAFT_835179 [Suillus discolor]KAG2113066.1 hypothetical protein F5147DRAFT_835179 [Suillus discolor]